MTTQILTAYRALRTETGRRAVSIEKLVGRSGLPMDAALEVVRALCAARCGNPVEGDWALASDSERAAALTVGGRPHLIIDLSDAG